MRDQAIRPARGEPLGVDVEVEPFGRVNPYSRRSPKRETGAKGNGAYVEFDLPDNAIFPPEVEPRNCARIPTDGPLSRAAARIEHFLQSDSVPHVRLGEICPTCARQPLMK